MDADGADKVPAGSVRFSAAMGVDVAPDGALYVASRSGLSRVSRPFPVTKDGILEIPSKDGREVYCFDPPAATSAPWTGSAASSSGASPTTTRAG